MTMLDREQRSSIAAALVYPVFYFTCAVAALLLSQGEDGIAAIWPASGVFIAGLLLVDPQRRSLVIGGVAIASLAANLMFAVGLVQSIGYTIANIIEGLLVFRMLGGGERRDFAEPSFMFRFAGAVVVGSVASAAMAGVLSLNFSLSFLTSWASTVLLGMATVIPTIMFLVQDRVGRQRLTTWRGPASLSLVSLLTIAAFAQTAFPLLFLPMAGLAFATYAIGLSGSAIALVIVAAIGSTLTAYGMGPVGIFLVEIEAQVLYFQTYLLCLIISILPLALLLSKQQQIARQQRKLAETDDLTGLRSRRKILADLQTAVENANAGKGPLTIALIDLDNFKSINDRFGHDVGDAVLLVAADKMRKEMGFNSQVGRLGGEEFLVIFPRAMVGDVLFRCEGYRKCIDAHDFTQQGADQVTLSIGIAEFTGEVDACDLLREADSALYRAKKEGRNRVFLQKVVG